MSKWYRGAPSLTRRGFLHSAAQAGLCASAAGLTFNSFHASRAYAAEEAVLGGVLTINFPSDPPNFDPISNTTSRTLYSVAPCYSKLVMFDPSAPETIVGDLAVDWEVSADGLTYTFKLKPGVVFHDGVPLTSADVKHTFDAIRNPPPGVVSVRQSMLTSIKEIDTPDDGTVRFVLERPSSSFLSRLANGWMLVLPKHIMEERGDMKDVVIGSGPFMFKSYRRGVSVELVRNPNYHVPGRPYLDGITYYVVPDPATTYSYFVTGQILVYDNMGGDDAERAAREAGGTIEILSGLGGDFAAVFANSTRGPWSDLRVRRAMSLAIDREAGLQVLYQGYGSKGGAMPPSGMWALPEAELSQIPGYGNDRQADLAEATRLLADAGYPDGFSTTLMTRRQATAERSAVFVQDQLRKVGIAATLDLQEDATALDNLINKNFDIVSWIYTAGDDDPDAVFSEFYTCNAPRNYSGICLEDVDEMFRRQSEAMDVDERRSLVNEMERRVLQEVSRAVLFWRVRFIGKSRQVQNLFKYPQDDNFRQFQDVWLSA